MGLDIRFPIGLMFSLVGALMVIYGLATDGDAEMYKRSLGININVIWGFVLLIFGVLMFVFAWRNTKKQPAGPGAPQQ